MMSAWSRSYLSARAAARYLAVRRAVGGGGGRSCAAAAASRGLRSSSSPPTSPTSPYQPPPYEAPPPPAGLSEEEAAGRDLAKLALIARAMRTAIAESGAAGLFTPALLVQLERTVEEANALVSGALERANRPCTVDQLADRVNADVVALPRGALDFRQLLRAAALRNEFELCMVQMNILPPREALVDGSGKPFCRLERKERRRREFEQLGNPQGPVEEADPGNDTQKRRLGMPVLSEGDLARRKAELEAASNIENLLRGYETALLDVSRVHKVTRGGTTMSVRALVVIGNRAGTAGYGEGKSDTPAHAIERACRDATRNLLYIDRYKDRTIYHNAVGKYVRSRVTLWPAPEGRGISANNNFAAVFHLFGIKDVGAKLHGPRSMANAVKALFNGLSQIRSAEEIASTRGLRLLSEQEGRATHNRQLSIRGIRSQLSSALS